MSYLKFEEMWKLMSSYKFEVKETDIDIDLICIICKKLMINACQSACGCQYCHACISEYLGHGDKYCPGGKEDCKEEYLEMERDVMKNMRMNNRIFKLQVKCPHQSCQTITELGNMESHLRVCNKQPSKCPFSVIGCSKLSNHDQSDGMEHNEILMEWLINLKNEVNELKKNDADVKIKKLVDEMYVQRDKILTLEENSKIKNTQIVTLEEKVREMSQLLKTMEEAQLREKDMELRIQQINLEIYNLKLKIKNKINKRMESVQYEIDSISKRVDHFHRGNVKEEFKSNHSFHDIANESKLFTWKINNISKVRNKFQTIFSDGFYMQDYKLCLSAYIGGNDISLWCYIMKGKNDSRVVFPMKKTVTISILNQQTLEPYKYESYQYETYRDNYKMAFDRPTGERNDYSIGSSLFLRFSEIKKIPSIIVNDNILVSCMLSNPESC